MSSLLLKLGKAGRRTAAERRELAGRLRAELKEPDRVHQTELPADLSRWPEEWGEAFEERAGIMAFDGGLARLVAEREAELRVRAEYRSSLERAPP